MLRLKFNENAPFAIPVHYIVLNISNSFSTHNNFVRSDAVLVGIFPSENIPHNRRQIECAMSAETHKRISDNLIGNNFLKIK